MRERPLRYYILHLILYCWLIQVSIALACLKAYLCRYACPDNMPLSDPTDVLTSDIVVETGVEIIQVSEYSNLTIRLADVARLLGFPCRWGIIRYKHNGL